MLEPKTTKMVNDLIQDLARCYIVSCTSKKTVNPEDIRALAELVSAVNVPPEQTPEDPAPIVGFVAQDQADTSDGDDE